jgi:hypothetical protein
MIASGARNEQRMSRDYWERAGGIHLCASEKTAPESDLMTLLFTLQIFAKTETAEVELEDEIQTIARAMDVTSASFLVRVGVGRD